MVFKIFGQNNQEIELSDGDYYYHLLTQTLSEIETLFKLKEEFPKNRKKRNELRFQKRNNKNRLRFLIYDFQELKACEELFFVTNQYLAKEYIRLIRKALYCKNYKNYEHFQKKECIWQISQSELFA